MGDQYKRVCAKLSGAITVDKYHLLALGILAVISGPFYSWNVGLSVGFGTFAIFIALMGWAYSCFCFCASELSSALPFAGGSYGLARCTLGYYFGYLTGCCEIMYYILLASFINEGIAQFMMSSNHSLKPFHPLIIFLIFVTQILAIAVDSRFFWRFVLLLTIYSVIMILIYCLGLIGYVDFSKWAYSVDSFGHKELFVGGINEAMAAVPYSLYFYIGAELLNLTCNEVKLPRTEVPFGQIGTMWAMFIQSILILFIACSFSPGTQVVQTRLAPLCDGYQFIFGIGLQTATLLVIIPAYGSGLSCVFGVGKLISAMASSKIFPSVLAKRSLDNSPVSAMAVGSLVGFTIIMLLTRFYMNGISIFYNATLVLAFIIYVPQCVGFIVMRRRMTNVPREYTSPVGVAGAIYAIIMFVIGIIACFFFQNDNHSTLFMFIGFVGALTVHYVAYVRYKQTFSADEREVMFVAHVQTAARPRQGNRIIPQDSQYSNYYSFARFGLRFQNMKNDIMDQKDAMYLPNSDISRLGISEAARPSQIPFSLYSRAQLSSHDSHQQSGKEELCELDNEELAAVAAEISPSGKDLFGNGKLSNPTWGGGTSIPQVTMEHFLVRESDTTDRDSTLARSIQESMDLNSKKMSVSDRVT